MNSLRDIVRQVVLEVLRPSETSYANAKGMAREFRLKGVPEHTFYGRSERASYPDPARYIFYFLTDSEGFVTIGYLENGNLFGVKSLRSGTPFTQLGSGYGKRLTEAARVIFHHLDKIIGPEEMFALEAPYGKDSYIVYDKKGNDQHGGVVGKLYGDGEYYMNLDSKNHDWDADGKGFMEGPVKFMRQIWLMRQKSKSNLKEEFSKRALSLVYTNNNIDPNSKFYQEKLVAEFPDVDGIYVTQGVGKHDKRLWKFYSKKGEFIGGMNTVQGNLYWYEGDGLHAQYFTAEPEISYDNDNPDLKNAARYLYLNVLQTPVIKEEDVTPNVPEITKFPKLDDYTVTKYNEKEVIIRDQNKKVVGHIEPDGTLWYIGLDAEGNEDSGYKMADSNNFKGNTENAVRFVWLMRQRPKEDEEKLQDKEGQRFDFPNIEGWYAVMNKMGDLVISDSSGRTKGFLTYHGQAWRWGTEEKAEHTDMQFPYTKSGLEKAVRYIYLTTQEPIDEERKLRPLDLENRFLVPVPEVSGWFVLPHKTDSGAPWWDIYDNDKSWVGYYIKRGGAYRLYYEDNNGKMQHDGQSFGDDYTNAVRYAFLKRQQTKK